MNYFDSFTFFLFWLNFNFSYVGIICDPRNISLKWIIFAKLICSALYCVLLQDDIFNSFKLKNQINSWFFHSCYDWNKFPHFVRKEFITKNFFHLICFALLNYIVLNSNQCKTSESFPIQRIASFISQSHN